MSHAHGVAAPTPQGHRFRELVVDHDRAAADHLAEVLAADFEVVRADSPAEALELLHWESFHVVCSADDTPGMSGLDLLAVAARDPEPTSTMLLVAAERKHAVREARHYVMLEPYAPARMVERVTQLARIAGMKRNMHIIESAVRKKPQV